MLKTRAICFRIRRIKHFSISHIKMSNKYVQVIIIEKALYIRAFASNFLRDKGDHKEELIRVF